MPSAKELREIEGHMTGAPWHVHEMDNLFIGNGTPESLWEIVYMTSDKMADLTTEAQEQTRSDAAGIVALRNAYADGSLIHRDEVPDDPRVVALVGAAKKRISSPCAWASAEQKAECLRETGGYPNHHWCDVEICTALAALGGDE